MKLRQASPTKSWQNITPEHTEIHNDIQNAILNVSEGGEEDPRAIVGAYGSGKTQLLYEAFDLAWEAGIPALYTDAETLLEGFEVSKSDSFTEWLSNRIREQVQTLSEHKEVAWLPNFSTQSDLENWLTQAPAQADLSGDEVCVLLVDEVEQVYENLQDRIGKDDENTLRGILDEVQDAYQIWSFGLVSAYEILGEADLRRFKELRVPVLEPEDVARLLREHNKPIELTNGIWWLARGRAGWVNKLVDEAPEGTSNISDWFSIVSDYEFFGTNPVDQSVVTNQLQNESERWDSARRSLVFLEDGLEEWEIRQTASVPVQGAADALTNILSSDSNVSSQAIRIIERNLDRVLESLSTNRWQSLDDTDEQSVLPIRIFTQQSEIAGLLTLLQNQITSFEPRGEDRGSAIELLRDIEANSITNQWPLQNVETIEVKSRTTKPSIIEQAYPSISVDPEILTDHETSELRESIDEPIEIDPGIRTNHSDVHVLYCPTETTRDRAIEVVKQSTSVPETFLLIIPDTREAEEWDDPDIPSEFDDFNRVTILSRGTSQLHDFLIQLEEYLGSAEIITDEAVNSALADETDRKIIDTIETLFRQVSRLSRNRALEVRDQFVDAYSLTDEDTPLWSRNSLNDSFWAYGRRTSVQLTGLAYAIAVSEGDWSGNRDMLNLPIEILDGYEKGFLGESASQEFGYQQFLDLIFLSDRFRQPMEETREEFGSAQGSVDPAVRRLQNLLLFLTDLHVEKSEKELRDDLLDSSTDIDKIEIIQTGRYEHRYAPALLWGLLLDGLVRDYSDTTIESLDELQRDLDEIGQDISNARDRIDKMNDQLQPYEGYGKGVEIKRSPLGEYESNISAITNGTEALSEAVKSDRSLASIAEVLRVIATKYILMVDESIQNIINQIYDTDITFNVESIKSRFTNLQYRIDESEELVADTPLAEEELSEKLSIIGNEIFDFAGTLGTTSLSVNDISSLKELENKLERNLDDLKELEDTLDQLERVQKRKKNTRDELASELSEFLLDVIEGEVVQNE